jgi:hypothetical protein
MKARASWTVVVGTLLGGFAGGLLSQWTLAGRAVHAEAAVGAAAIRTQAVVLVDAEGNEQGSLAATADGAGLILKDAQGRERVNLGYSGGDEPYWSLVFTDAEGKSRFTCGARADGEGSGMGVQDWNGTLRVGLGAARYGCGLTLSNEEGKEIVGAGVGPAAGGGDFVLKHPFDGHELWRASQQAKPAE